MRLHSRWIGVLTWFTVGARLVVADEPIKADPAWTPPPKEGNVAAWQKTTDKDWIDDRFRRMDTGPFLNASFQYPHGGKTVSVQRGTAIRLGDKGEAAVLFDRNQLRLCCGWFGWLNHKDVRFGLLNTPTPNGELVFASPGSVTWFIDGKAAATPFGSQAPMPQTVGRFVGIRTAGSRVSILYEIGGSSINEQLSLLQNAGKSAFVRRISMVGSGQLGLVCAEVASNLNRWSVRALNDCTAVANSGATCVAVVSNPKGILLRAQQRQLLLDLPKLRGKSAMVGREVKLLYWSGLPTDFDTLLQQPTQRETAVTRRGDDGGKPGLIWGPPLATRGRIGTESGALAIDTLTLPFTNPYNALLFCTGLDFLSNGRMAVCTAHGDIWIVNADPKLERIEWKRFATGLYQPLGLKIVNNIIYVIERGQLTKVIDTDGDGEADLYESFCDQWHCGGGEHSFDTRLETDPMGNFYFFKTGDTNTPTGGCLMRVSRDGKKCEIFATGFRHPIGLGISPKGQITGGDQQGNWMPASRIDEYKQGGFYGDMRAHHRVTAPKTYDGPLFWLPHEVDNSCGGQVWTPTGAWGPLGGRMIHLSWGQCRAFLTFRQIVQGQPQGGAVDLGLFFESGPIGGRFSPHDGHLYVAGLQGWQTAAQKDGCIQRVRYTGKPFFLPLELDVRQNGVEISFTQLVDPQKAADPSRYRIAMWGYRWTKEYGSKRYSTIDPRRLGEDTIAVTKATLKPDGKTVFLNVAGLRPTMQMQIEYRLATRLGEPMNGAIHNTIHSLEAAKD